MTSETELLPAAGSDAAAWLESYEGRLREALAAGTCVLGLNVFGHNTVTIALYTRLGYRVIDQSRTILL